MNFHQYRAHILLGLAILAFIGLRAYRNRIAADDTVLQAIMEPHRAIAPKSQPTPAPTPAQAAATEPTPTFAAEENVTATPEKKEISAQPCGPNGCATPMPTPSAEELEKAKLEEARKREAFLAERCAKKDADACLTLGRSYVGKKDSAKAFEFLRQACLLGRNQEVCGDAAAVMKPENAGLLSKGCAEGNSKDCFMSAILTYQSGKKEEGIRLGKKACRDGMIEACGVVGETMSYQDYSRAVDTCKTGDVEGCLAAGGYEKSKGHLKEALNFLSSACESGNDRSCFAYGENSGTESLPVLKDQCNGGKKAACLKLAGIEAEKDVENTDETKYMQLACKAGSQQACDALKALGK